MISHSPSIFSPSPPINYLTDDYANHNAPTINCIDKHNRASHYCRPQLLSFNSKGVIDNVAAANGSRNAANQSPIFDFTAATGPPRYTLQGEFLLTKPTLSPKSCLRPKSCLHIPSIKSVVPVPDKNSNTPTSCNEQSRTRKKVIFADGKGLSLTQVRVMSEPSNVPPNWNKHFFDQITQGLVTPQPADQWTVDFKQPASEYLSFRQTIERDFVSLENVIVRDEESLLVGTVKVKNIAFEKEVIVRATWDDWKSQQDIFCIYNKAYGPHMTSAHAIFDTFSFKITLPPQSKRLEFCICFRSGGNDYWDNNQGKNYTITKRSPFYYSEPHEKIKNQSEINLMMSSYQTQFKVALNVDDTKDNWHPDIQPYW